MIRDLVHGHEMSSARVSELLASLAAMTNEERLAIPTMEPGRADVIVAGALILERLLAFTDAGKLTDKRTRYSGWGGAGAGARD